MIRLLTFLSLLVGFVLIMNLSGYKKFPLKNEKFHLATLEKEHAAQKLAAMAPHPEEKGEGEGEEAGEDAGVVKEVVIPLDTEELKNGHFVYNSKGKCTTCHGKSGEGRKSQQAPKLAGQHDWYLFDQLVNMKAKVRVNKQMDPYLKNLEEKDFKDVAHYLSKLPAP